MSTKKKNNSSNERPFELLKSIFGFESFRGDQEEIINHTLAGGHSLVLMPTGMGKSVCYQIPSKIFDGVTLVVSPLIALMKDQVDQALAKGFKCCFINSSLSREERLSRYKNLREGQYELVYVTPERFRNPEFVEAISSQKVKLLAVDEAHCISEWGHDFRPDYSRLFEIRTRLGLPVTMALTATATPDVQSDIITQLGLKPEEVTTFHHGMERKNLALSVSEVYGLEDKVRHFVGIWHQRGGPAIIYFSLISSLMKFSEQLRKLSIPHGHYHGQLNDRDRRRNQEQFLESNNGLILATPAFGLGVDKPNIRLVIHAEVPGTLEAYYQEVGRAGRDGNPAWCNLFYEEDDVTIQMDFIKWSHPEPEFIKGVYSILEKYPDRVKQEGLDFIREQMNYFNSRDFRLETSISLLERWGCIQGTLSNPEFKTLTPPSEEWLDPVKESKRLKYQQEKLLKMVQYPKSTECRQKFIYEYFGMTDSIECGICDVCSKT